MSAALAPALAAGLGAVAWTLLEYLIHRHLGHGGRARHNPFGVEHLRHHATGDYFAPTWKKVVAAALLVAALGPVAAASVGAAVGLAFVGGLVAMYGLYEWLHRREHTHAGAGPYGRWARRHHFRHHLVDARGNFGVTTPLWDLVFGTYAAPPAVLEVPPRLAMRWLVDPGTGAVRPEHAAAYALRARGPAGRAAAGAPPDAAAPDEAPR